MKIQRTLAAKASALLKCRLCRQISLVVCLSIVVIEIAILVPSYLNLRGELYDRLETDGLHAIDMALQDHDHHPLGILLADMRDSLRQSNVMGGSIYGEDGDLLASFGETPVLAPGFATPGQGRNRAHGAKHRMEFLRPADGGPLPFTIVTRMNAEDASDQLNSFILRIGGLVLIISAFVSVVTVAAFGVLVLNPLLEIRGNLKAAQDDPTNAERYRLDLGRDDEIGETAAALNALLSRLSDVRRSDVHDREQRFKDFADASSDWFWEMDDKLRFSYFSDRFAKVAGVLPEALLGKTRQQTGIPGVDGDTWRRHLADLAARRPFRDFTHPRTLPDGRTVHLSINGRPVFDLDGTFTGYRGTGRDVTSQIMSERALRESQEALAKAQNLAAIGNWRWSIERDALISCSDEYARIHGVSMERIHDLAAHRIDRIVHPEDRAELAESLRRFRQDGSDYEIEYRIVPPDGMVRCISEIGETVLDADGKAIEQFGTIQDVTEMKLREAALIIAKQQAEIANRSKSEFLANMSHELRTPLNAVIGFAEIMKEGRMGPIGNPRYLDYVEDIHESGRHLLDLIDDVLDLSKIETGNATLEEEKLDVAQIIESCIRLIRPRVEAGGLDLVLDVPVPQLSLMRADPRMMKQILINLLSNAVKFTSPGGRIDIVARSRPADGVVIQVSDTGIGIAAEDIPKALARFQQVDGRLNRKFEGSGLGLSLSNSLTELHDGTLELESQVGVGTTATIRFPAQRIVPSHLDSDAVGEAKIAATGRRG